MRHSSHPLFRSALCLLALLFASSLSAEVYRTVDENGNVIYSDKPMAENSESMDLPPLSIMDPATIAPRPEVAGDDQEGEGRYADLSISEPVADQTYWGTAATLGVQLNTSTRPRRGDEFIILLDGMEVSRSNSLAAVLTGVERGEHQVSAQVVDAQGNALARVGPVTIHMKQQSAQNPNN